LGHPTMDPLSPQSTSHPAPHQEHHFTGSAHLRDLVIGMSDGLTVPFALAAGLSGAAVSSRVVVTAGLAEIAAGSIAMGLGGYLAARSDAEHYASELAREEREIVERPQDERREVAEVFEHYGLSAEESRPLVEALAQRPVAWRACFRSPPTFPPPPCIAPWPPPSPSPAAHCWFSASSKASSPAPRACAP